MDDASLSSTVEKVSASAAEESGWTEYFEDFFASQKREDGSGNCSTGGNYDGRYSMISDAASCAKWNFPASETRETAKKNGKKLSFRKRKSTLRFLDDDSLEDTASSPVNSPKVLREKEVGHENFTEVRRNDHIDELGVKEECTHLKKKGLCLVPLSMLVHYLV